MLRNELLGVADQLLAQGFIVEVLARGSVPGFGGFDTDGGFGFDCAFAGLGEVVVGVAEEGGDAAGDGFDDVLAAGINEAAADEGNICAEVVGGQFAHAVAYPNLCIWGNGLSVAAFLDGITKRFGGIIGRLKVFRVARYDDQQGIAAVALPCFEEQLGFIRAFVHARAGADDDGACADAFFKGDGKRTQVVGGRDVVFGVAADVDVGRADKVKAFGIGGGLGKAAGEALHGRLDQLADFEVAALGFFGEARVGQKEGNACFLAAVHQVGPDFGFHQNAADGAVFG